MEEREVYRGIAKILAHEYTPPPKEVLLAAMGRGGLPPPYTATAEIPPFTLHMVVRARGPEYPIPTREPTGSAYISVLVYRTPVLTSYWSDTTIRDMKKNWEEIKYLFGYLSLRPDINALHFLKLLLEAVDELQKEGHKEVSASSIRLSKPISWMLRKVK